MPRTDFSVRGRFPDRKLYFTNDRLIAGLHDFTFPESSDAAAAFDRASILGRSQKLVVADLGIIAELFGDDIHFTDGQGLWTYFAPVTLPGTENTANLPVYLSMRAVENHVYMAEWLAPQDTENSSSALKLEGMKGYSKLTAEEKNLLPCMLIIWKARSACSCSSMSISSCSIIQRRNEIRLSRASVVCSLLT